MTSNIKSSIPSACILLPTFNEAENIHKIIDSILNLNEIQTHKIVILVIDDNSTDGTQDIVNRLIGKHSNVYMIQGEKIGLGDAYKRGFEHSIKVFDPEIIIQMDSDGQHDPKVIKDFIDNINHGYELVIGSRYIEGSSTPNFSIWRKSISIIGNFLVRYLCGIYFIKDCTSGYRCIKTDLLRKVNLDDLYTKGYSFQSSLITQLIRENAVAKEVPITFKEREGGNSKLALQDQIEFIIFIFRLRLKNSDEFLRYSLVGLFGTALNFIIYWWLTRIILIQPEIASLIAIEISIINNFILNNFWTFKKRLKRNSILKRVYRFHMIAGIAGGANYLTFLFMINALSIFDLYSLLIGICIGAIFNYSGNSLWTFRRHGEKKR